MRIKIVPSFPISAMLLLAGCLSASVQKDLILPRDYQPGQYERVAVINLDRQVDFSEYVEAELLRKGYKVKEGFRVVQVLRKEGFFVEESINLDNLGKIGALLDVQGIVFCRILEFSRFRDSYRLSIKMVAPHTGNIVWSAQGAKEGRRGQKSSDLLKEIVHSTLKKLPPHP
ncbi:MAG: hypothetical protein HY882_10845 [Deltaproteobacteria bacterium]|nr:hypothetical protein [Deltaproteobacteria bacterium]